MVSRFLITTALEKTWPDDSKIPVLFLGEWCRIYSRKERWSKMNAEVLAYHWDDRHKLYNDYQYLTNIYENTLKSLQKQLNGIHKVDHSLRYWRILIGPWLGYFLQMVFDRWKMLKIAFDNYEIRDCRILVKEESNLIPNDMIDFYNLYTDDNWNEMIYSELLQEHFQNDIMIEFVKENNDQRKQSHKPNRSFESLDVRLKRCVMSAYTQYKHWFHDSDNYFFIDTSLTPSFEEKLLLRLGQNPRSWKRSSIAKFNVDNKMREWTLYQNDSMDVFSTIISQMISRHMPITYLEGYKSLIKSTLELQWPKNPKCIFTSVSFIPDDIFKAYAGEKTEENTKLIIGQHGGHYGLSPWSFEEDHQINIADKWLSWGWSDNKNTKIVPLGNLKALDNTELDYDPNGHAFMVEMTLPRYSYQMFAVPVAGQWLSYFNDQCKFISALTDSLRNQVLIRLSMQDYGWCQKERWLKHFPQIKIESGHKPIHNLIKKSRLFISTYNATTYLESFTWNMPTIIFWNSNHWELRDDAIPYFELLKSVKIFHETPESAAKHMVEVWDDISAWWYSNEVQIIRKNFCEQYSWIPDKPLESLDSIFSSL